NDHLGMPKELVDARGRVAWAAAHSAWGRILEEQRDPGVLAVGSPFRLLGQYADDETGLCWVRFRYFDASVGRWRSPDPLGVLGGPNLPAFDGSPLAGSDPLGLACGAPRDARLVQIIRYLRSLGTPEADATAAAIRKGKAQVQFLPTDPTGR